MDEPYFRVPTKKGAVTRPPLVHPYSHFGSVQSQASGAYGFNQALAGIGRTVVSTVVPPDRRI